MTAALTTDLFARLAGIVGADAVQQDPVICDRYGRDALQRGCPADIVVIPACTSEVAAVLHACNASRVPVTVRGAGTGYVGGAVPIRGGVVLSMERFTRLLAIDEENLLAVAQPGVLTGALQAAVEARGLFYPPDPASLRHCSLGGNVATGAGGPRAVKYGTTGRYVLGLEAVLPTGEVIRTGGKTVKHAVGYDLTHLLVGSEGTLAVLTELTLRLVPRPAEQAVVSAAFRSLAEATGAVTAILQARIVPATIELLDAASLRAAATHAGRALAPAGTDALLLIESDGAPASVGAELPALETLCRQHGALATTVARHQDERDALWDTRRQMSLALRAQAPRKINHDVVVPRGRIPALFDLIRRLEADSGISMPSFGHAGDGNIHVNLLVDPSDTAQMMRAARVERALFEGVVALEGTITGEHGVGYAKAAHLGLALGPTEQALMARIKAAFDPHGILNPGKQWETQTDDLARVRD